MPSTAISAPFLLPAMRRLARARDLIVEDSLLYRYKRHDRNYFEAWLHEAGHALDLNRGVLPRNVSDRLADLETLPALAADHNEAFALAFELRFASRTTWPIGWVAIENANPQVLKFPELRRAVRTYLGTDRLDRYVTHQLDHLQRLARTLQGA